MAAKKRKNGKQEGNETVEAIKDLMIIQLGVAGVPQAKVRQIVGCDINRVSRILKHLKTKEEQPKAKRATNRTNRG